MREDLPNWLHWAVLMMMPVLLLVFFGFVALVTYTANQIYG